MKLYLDYDNVLVDLVSPWLDWIKDHHRYKIKSTDILHWNWLEQTYGQEINEFWKTEGVYFDKVSPLPGAVFFVDALRKIFNEEDIFIISASHDTMIWEKEKHAKHYFNIPAHRFLHKHDKYRWTSDGILVDDSVSNISNHVAYNNLPGFLFNYRNSYGWSKLYNPMKNLYAVQDYGTLLEMICSPSVKMYFKEN